MADPIADLVLQVGRLGLWIQAVGLIVVLWIIVAAVTMYFNRKRRKLLEDIDSRLKKIEEKINSLTRKKARQ